MQRLLRWYAVAIWTSKKTKKLLVKRYSAVSLANASKAANVSQSGGAECYKALALTNLKCVVKKRTVGRHRSIEDDKSQDGWTPESMKRSFVDINRWTVSEPVYLWLIFGPIFPRCQTGTVCMRFYSGYYLLVWFKGRQTEVELLKWANPRIFVPACSMLVTGQVKNVGGLTFLLWCGLCFQADILTVVF